MRTGIRTLSWLLNTLVFKHRIDNWDYNLAQAERYEIDKVYQYKWFVSKPTIDAIDSATHPAYSIEYDDVWYKKQADPTCRDN